MSDQIDFESSDSVHVIPFLIRNGYLNDQKWLLDNIRATVLEKSSAAGLAPVLDALYEKAPIEVKAILCDVFDRLKTQVSSVLLNLIVQLSILHEFRLEQTISILSDELGYQRRFYSCTAFEIQLSSLNSLKSVIATR